MGAAPSRQVAPSEAPLVLALRTSEAVVALDFISKYAADANLPERTYFVKIGTLMMSGRGSWLLTILVCKQRMTPEDLVAAIRRANPRFQAAFPNAALFDPLFSGMVSFRAPTSSSVPTPLSALTPADAGTVGKALSACLCQSKTASDALVLWQEQYPSVRSLFLADPSFEALALTIAQRKLVEEAPWPWGVALRVGVGAFLSSLDMATDIYAINRFWRQGQVGFATASGAMIGAAILVQILIVYGQGRKRGLPRVCREIVILLSTLKPAVDAYRVVRWGEERHEGDAFDAMTELMMAKTAEM